MNKINNTQKMSMNNSKENAEVITATELLKLDKSNIVFEGQTEVDENFDYSVFYSIHNKFYEVKQNMYDFVRRSKK